MNSSAQINLQTDVTFLLESGLDVFAYIKKLTIDYPVQNIKFLNTKDLTDDIATLLPFDIGFPNHDVMNPETNFNYFNILQELNSPATPDKWILIDCNKINLVGLCDLIFKAFKTLQNDFDITIPSCQPNGDLCLIGFGKESAISTPQENNINKSNTTADILKKIVRIILLCSELDFKITPRELECIDWVGKGKTSNEISSILSITESTVDKHVATVCRKLNTVNRMQMVAKAVRLGLI